MPETGYGGGISAPASRSVPVVKHDTTELTPVPKAIYVGTAGSIIGRLADDDSDRTFKDVAVGEHPLRFKLIRTTSTAADILALY